MIGQWSDHEWWIQSKIQGSGSQGSCIILRTDPETECRTKGGFEARNNWGPGTDQWRIFESLPKCGATLLALALAHHA